MEMTALKETAREGNALSTIYYIDQDREKRNTAGAKAPDDIATLCERRGYSRFQMPLFPSGKNKLYQKLWLLFVCSGNWLRLMRTVKDGDWVIYQHPMYGNRVIDKMVPRIKKKTGCRFIAVIHDLESLRGGIAGVIKNHKRTDQIADEIMLKRFDAVICHNDHMKQYMVDRGFQPSQLFSLEIFDYLTDCKRERQHKDVKPSIAIAGNLAIGKCRYIYEIFRNGQNPNLTVNLYGNNYCEEKSSGNMIWHGSFKPEELPEHLSGDFGLVWDGPAAETCEGNTGAYMRYNNPHKTSLYLSSGMPVIVWREAAIADYVLKTNTGIVVDSLDDLERTIGGVSPEQYQEMCRNAADVAQKLRSGFYFYCAIDRILS